MLFQRWSAILLLVFVGRSQQFASSFPSPLRLSARTHSRRSSLRCPARRRRRILPQRQSSGTAATELRAAAGKKEGIYSRPSSAIERGSGFFVPGLEGPKVRLVFGSILLLLTAVNHVLQSDNAIGNTFSESLTVAYAALVLLQGIVESRKEGPGILTGSSHSSSDIARMSAVVSFQQQWSVPVENIAWKERVEWAAATFLALTPGTHFMLLGPGSIVYSLGTSITTNYQDACQAAVSTIRQSKSGRVALPTTHPAATVLADTNSNRCVVLQKVNSDLCLMMTSDQLLAAFTKQDLLWLGQLALYIDPDEQL